MSPMPPRTESALRPATPEVIATLVDNHRRFLAFLERRTGSREVAEDLLQDAFVHGLDRVEEVRDPEAITAWFYRTLRNRLTDYYRRRAAEARALERAAGQAEEFEPAIDEELMDVACGCLRRLVSTLKPEYAAALERVDLDGASVQAFAGEAGITANNASVRLHRARHAMRQQVARTCGTCAEHGCLDCSCGGPA